ncbi:MAG: capsule assembly Wzi family protein [Bacteroidia bacterium]|nr:capsule assembly Wzi family protein [Bacteroidia bacterium]
MKAFYKKKPDLLYVDEPAFDLHVRPVIYFGAGSDSRKDDMLFINTRGVEVRGMIDRKVGFYSIFTDNQARLPSYVDDYMGQYFVLPHEGFWKDFKDGQGVDFLHARGHISFEATKHINIQFGHDRLFVGNGQRSLIFSDFAPPFLFLKTNVRVWKLNYVFSLNRMTAAPEGSIGGSSPRKEGYPNKFVAFHHLSVNIGKKFNVGVFESVVFSTDDSLGRNEFEWAYLNPIIFYRAIEQQNGSSDNVLLGLDFKWNLVPKVSLYGQFMLDEFLLDNILDGNGWWANKFGIQGGLKYIDALGVSNLDLQGEINVVRPYTYSHNTTYGSYSNYYQPIAHPLGANFTELLGVARYQPVPRLNVIAKLSVAKVGRDTTNVNWGGDILKNNSTREQEYNNTVGQGIDNNIAFGSLTASWQWKHNVFIDVNFSMRKSTSDVAFYNTNSTIGTVAFRWNMARRLYEF